MTCLRIIWMEDLTFQELKKSKFYRPEVTEVTHDVNQFFLINHCLIFKFYQTRVDLLMISTEPA